MVKTVRIIRILKNPGTKDRHCYWLVKCVNTTANLANESSMTEAIKKVEDEGWILQPD